MKEQVRATVSKVPEITLAFWVPRFVFLGVLVANT
ncbi:putative membrane-anchored protein [Granulicella aggregans]|uniref:Putative membrane-anchored protein n=1 Tax=Granulicella aggregans TaxID=474949 RepID=A0A7W8E591_9BACT|nr:putative membrane-anchored protein [Granulicella aggregans]